MIEADRAIPWVEGRTGLALAPSQREAVRLVLAAKVLVITGGPGVGKTTLVNAIPQVIRAKGVEVVLAAPIGRAAKRLSESTGLEARTIHRLLESDPGSGGFKRDEANPLTCGLLVVDGTSMVDVPLMRALLRALPDEAALLLVGDVDQLPSVGPGQVLADIIGSGTVPVVRLTEVFRQAAESRVIVNAHRINCGRMPDRGVGRAGAGLRHHDPQGPGIGIPGGGDPAHHAALCHAGAQPALYRRDPGPAAGGAGRPAPRARHRRTQRRRQPPLEQTQGMARPRRERSRRHHDPGLDPPTQMPWRADRVPGGDAARPTRWHGLPAGPCGCGSRPALPAGPRWRGRYPAPASAARSPIPASRPGGAGHHASSEPCASLGGKAKVQLLVRSTITRPGWRSGRAVVACGSCRRLHTVGQGRIDPCVGQFIHGCPPSLPREYLSLGQEAHEAANLTARHAG